MKKEDIKKTVRKRYAGAAKSGASCCSPSLSCCGETGVDNRNISRQVGYSPEDLAKVPEESNLGLGCGNPTAVAGLKEGEIVLDLGAGAGIDCFLASSKVGPSGRIIGVDMTPEMVDRARENARQNGYANVEFRLGEIENLPAADNSVDVIISNCVINLSPEKDRVFREAYRVLKPGGRMLVSDIVLREPLPEAIRESAEVYTACVAGAMLREDYLREIRAAGFGNVEVVSERSFPADFVLEDAATLELIHKLNISRQELSEAIGSIISLNVKAVKAG
jgi:SAM-dependent methyltransferase